MTKSVSFFLLILILSSTSAVFAGKKTLTVPLVYLPQEGESIAFDATPYTSSIIKIEPFLDSRPDQSKIGQNIEDKNEAKPVYSGSDVAPFCREVLRNELSSVGLRISDENPTHILTGEVVEFFVTEGKTYDALVVIKITIKDAETGNTLYTGSGKGTGDNFGRSYKVENYQEVINRALLHAYRELMKQGSFLSALKAP